MFWSYPLKKSRHILKAAIATYNKQKGSLSKEKREKIENLLQKLDDALLQKDRKAASDLAKQVKSFVKDNFKSSPIIHTLEFIVGLGFALLIAVVIRQMWFELYQIPTGSMRPTFKELDRLTVTKTPFGLNVPMQTKHFYFDPELVQRTGVVIFSADNLPLTDQNDLYFYLFPAKRRFIKRLIGKPGDTLYFYGGKIYGMDKDGKPIDELLNAPSMQNLEHIPFITFHGNVSQPGFNEFVFHQFFQPIGRYTLSAFGGYQGQVRDGKSWVKGNAFADYFGIKNFATAEIVTDGEKPILELTHSPTLKTGRGQVSLDTTTSTTPLEQKHLDALMSALYTARFIVKDGVAKRYDINTQPFTKDNPKLKGIPDGTYEFYYGKAYRINWLGAATLLPESSPLYNKENLVTLFNQGILFTKNAPSNRYAYMRDGDLYIMGSPIIKDFNDPTFKDPGPPIKNGELDKELISKWGLKIPEKNYLVLGDNHAMSADSRVFGFVPEDNLQGAPSLILWPPGDRVGMPNQTAYPFLNFPRAFIWTLALIAAIIAYLIHRHNTSKPMFKK
jgi:signal peptidase I